MEGEALLCGWHFNDSCKLCLLSQPKEAWDYENVEEKRAEAERLKERGTTYFKADKFDLALKLYTLYDWHVQLGRGLVN